MFTAIPADHPADPAIAATLTAVGAPPALVTIPPVPPAVTPPKLAATAPCVRPHLLRLLRFLASARGQARSAMILHMADQLQVAPVRAGAIINLKRTALALVQAVEALQSLPTGFTVVGEPDLQAAALAFGHDHPVVGLGHTLRREELGDVPADNTEPDSLRESDASDLSPPDQDRDLSTPTARGHDGGAPAPSQRFPVRNAAPVGVDAVPRSLAGRFAALDPAVQAWLARASPEDMRQLGDAVHPDDGSLVSYDNSLGASIVATPDLAAHFPCTPTPASAGHLQSLHALRRPGLSTPRVTAPCSMSSPALDATKSTEQYHATYAYAVAMAALSPAAESSGRMSLPAYHNERSFYRECSVDMFCNTLEAQAESLRQHPPSFLGRALTATYRPRAWDMPPALSLLVAKGRWRRSSFAVSPVVRAEATLSAKWKDRSSFLSILHFLPREHGEYVCTSLHHVIHAIARCFYCFAAVGGFDDDGSSEPLVLQGWLRLLEHLQDEHLFPFADLSDQHLAQRALYWALELAQTILVHAIGFFQQPSVFLPVLAQPEEGINTEVVASSLGHRLIALRRSLDAFHVSSLQSAAIPDLTPFFAAPTPVAAAVERPSNATARSAPVTQRLKVPRLSPSPFLQFTGDGKQRSDCHDAIIRLLRERGLKRELCISYARLNSQGCSRPTCGLRHTDRFRHLDRSVQDVLRQVADSSEHRNHLKLLL